MQPATSMQTDLRDERESGPQPRQDSSIQSLVKKLLTESQALARAELLLIKKEMDEKAARVESGVVSLLVGAAMLSAGIVVLLFAAVYGLATTMPSWQAALIVGAVALLIGALSLKRARAKARPQNLYPERSVDEAVRSATHLKEKLS